MSCSNTRSRRDRVVVSTIRLIHPENWPNTVTSSNRLVQKAQILFCRRDLCWTYLLLVLLLQVWMMLEEKQIPYKIEKINMRYE